MPHHASGIRMEVYGRKGTLVLTSKSVNIGPSQLQLGIGKGEMKELVSPASYRFAPADMAQSPAVNVAQAYARYAAALGAGAVPAPDFGHAVVRHALIDALGVREAMPINVAPEPFLRGSWRRAIACGRIAQKQRNFAVGASSSSLQ